MIGSNSILRSHMFQIQHELNLFMQQKMFYLKYEQLLPLEDFIQENERNAISFQNTLSVFSEIFCSLLLKSAGTMIVSLKQSDVKNK